MKSEMHPQVPEVLRGFGGTLSMLGRQQWASSFDELAVSFERATTTQERRQLAEQGLNYFIQPYGLNEWLVAVKDMPDQELYRTLEASWMLIREILKRHL